MGKGKGEENRVERIFLLLSGSTDADYGSHCAHVYFNSVLFRNSFTYSLLACLFTVAWQHVGGDDLEIARLLLDAGYDLNDVPYRSSWYKFGGTAVKMAAEHGATDIVQLVLDHGADPDIPGTSC